MKALIGLGNPEGRYAGNRHNVGFLVVDRIANIAGCAVTAASQYSRYCRLSLWSFDTLLVKPQTFMNRSGMAVREMAERWEVVLPDMLVVYDDFALPLGKIRLRPGGSSGGHNGMQSIISDMGTSEIPRLRFGIGPPGIDNTAGFVLSDFSPSEMLVVQRGVDRAVEAIRSLWESGMMRAMSVFNTDPPDADAERSQ